MVIRLDNVHDDEPFRWQEQLEIKAQELDRPEVVALGPVSWEGSIARHPPDFYLHADYTYEQTLACVRCLRHVVEPVRGSLDLLVSVGQEPKTAGEHQLHAGDFGSLMVASERLDVMPLLIEQLQLEVPMRPLCQPNCQGLCPDCGADRNAGPCGCRPEAVDPRWAALAALRQKLPDSES